MIHINDLYILTLAVALAAGMVARAYTNKGDSC